MEFSDLLKNIAPWLAAAAAGPTGLAGMAIKTVAEALGSNASTADELASAVAGATPEQIATLKAKEMDFKVRMQDLGFKQETDLLKIAADDRDSARKANVGGGIQGWVLVLSVVILIICLGAEIVVLFKGIPPGANELVIGRVLGLLDAAAMMVLTYIYGSTAQTARHTELLAAAQPIAGAHGD